MSDAPRILAIETSGRAGSVAVACGGEMLAVRELSASQRHAVELMPAVRDLTSAQGWRPDQIDHVYLSIGPGSFTGLRIAVAVARALHQAVGCRLVGVPTLDVMAQNAPAEYGIVIPILDAKRGHVFAARYERDAAGELVQTAPPALVEPGAFVAEAMTGENSEFSIQNSEMESGPACGVRIALLGEALAHYQPPTDPRVTALAAEYWVARAAMVHRLGWALARHGRFSDPATLLPLYIRLPEAEEVYRRKHGAAQR